MPTEAPGDKHLSTATNYPRIPGTPGDVPSAIITLEDGTTWSEAVQSERPDLGLYASVPGHLYHGTWDLPSQSRMKVAIQKSPAHARFAQLNPKPRTKALDIGTAVHTKVLEPDTFEDTIEIGPTKTRTAQKWIDAVAANPELTFLTPEEKDTALIMADRLLELPELRRLLRPDFDSIRELSAVSDLSGAYPQILDGKMSKFELRAKSRMDVWTPYKNLCWNTDIKTSRDATEEAFDRDVKERGYHMQAAFYERQMMAHGLKIKHHMFAIVENVAPFEPVFRELSQEALDRGRVLMNKAVALWAWSVENNQYPGFPPGIGVANLPKWALGSFAPQTIWEEELSE